MISINCVIERFQYTQPNYWFTIITAVLLTIFFLFSFSLTQFSFIRKKNFFPCLKQRVVGFRLICRRVSCLFLKWILNWHFPNLSVSNNHIARQKSNEKKQNTSNDENIHSETLSIYACLLSIVSISNLMQNLSSFQFIRFNWICCCCRFVFFFRCSVFVLHFKLQVYYNNSHFNVPMWNGFDALFCCCCFQRQSVTSSQNIEEKKNAEQNIKIVFMCFIQFSGANKV